jgi:hypothetical protein
MDVTSASLEMRSVPLIIADPLTLADVETGQFRSLAIVQAAVRIEKKDRNDQLTML